MIVTVIALSQVHIEISEFERDVIVWLPQMKNQSTRSAQQNVYFWGEGAM